MEMTEGLALYRLFWALVGFPVLIGINGVAAYMAWMALAQGER